MMTVLNRLTSLLVAVFIIVFAMPAVGMSYDINEKLSVEGMLTGVYQYGDFDVQGLDFTFRAKVDK